MLTHCREGDRIVLEGEADQVPGQEPGDIVFGLEQSEHEIFRRAGDDLSADIEITLAEALCGFSRVVLKHLDGRGLHLQHPKAPAQVLNPGQTIKIEGEGMYHKKSDSKGDLYLSINVKFPEYQWLAQHQAIDKLRELLPEPEKQIEAEIIDNIEYNENANPEDFGEGEDEGGPWVDEDEDESSETRCAQQ